MGPQSDAADKQAIRREPVVELEALPDSVGEARRWVRDHLGRLGVDGDVVDVACLLTSELVTNAVVHAGGDITLRVRVDAGHVRVDVEDDHHSRPHKRRTTNTSMTGRGLTLVQSLATSWGVDDPTNGVGKVVWFEIAT